jgi:hypothetical protein
MREVIDNSKPYQIRSNIDCTISEIQGSGHGSAIANALAFALVLAADDMKAQAEQTFLIASRCSLSHRVHQRE